MTERSSSTAPAITCLFDVMGTAHHIFDGITFRNTDVAMLAGKKELAGADESDGTQLPIRERGIRHLDRIRGLERVLYCR